MHGTRVYSAAEIKAACEAIWNSKKLICRSHICCWHFWHFKKCGWRFDFLTLLPGRLVKLKSHRKAQMYRIRKHQVYGQSK
jgi:hypothetical protein